LAAAGVRVVILSGDDPLVVGRLAGLVGLRAQKVITGSDLAKLSADALLVQARDTDVFARLSPDQKVRIVHALRAAGEVVGFMGDGVNDAPGIKAADVGLSVDGATGVARAAADMILLDSDLAVVADGVEEGRRTFANILKYVRMGASSNFGNMLSMAVASLFLPFLPMLATQILLNNLLYDVSEIGLPFDNVRSLDIALRHGDLRRALSAIPHRPGGVPHKLVRRVHRDADPGGVSDTHPRAALAGRAKSRADYFDAGRPGGRLGDPVLAPGRLVRVQGAARRGDTRAGGHRSGLSGLRGAVQTAGDKCQSGGRHCQRYS
jgi:soluble P-type ATPase